MRRLSLVLLALTPCLFGYVRLNTGEATVIPIQRIDNTGIQFYLNSGVTPGVTSNLSGSNVTVISANSNPTQAIDLAQGAWNSVTTANVKFLPVQSTTKGHDSGDFTNVISIAANSNDLSVVNGVVAVTVNVWASSSGTLNGLTVVDGNIVDSDILLNPKYSFSTDGSTAGTTTGADLQAVLTHEFGHSLSANHTGVLGATMFQFTALSQRFLSTDDITFVSQVYPAAGSAAAPLGTVTGAVTLSGAGVPYALLTLIEQTQGLTLGGFTDASGNYTLQVPPGSYLMYAEPFNRIVQPGNLYLTSAQAALAQSASFQATFLGGNAGPVTFNVVANNTATENIVVSPALSALNPPFYAFGRANGSGDVMNVNQIVGPVPVVSGQTLDLCFVGAGFDATLSTSNVRIFGAGITVSSVKMDPQETFNINGATLPLIRVTITIPAQSKASLATIFISKTTSSTLPLSGVLVITPPAPVISSASLVSAASFLGSAPGKGGVSPGGIYSVYTPTGSPATLGPATPVGNAGYDPYGFLSTRLAGVSVTFDGIPAPLFFVYSGQINVQVPFEIAGRASTYVVVSYFGSTNTAVAVPVVKEQPAFFTITPEGTDSIIANQDGSINSKTNPAARGSYVTAYGTGVGNVAGLVTGQGATVQPTLPYNCTVGSVTGPAAFVGWTPTAVGLAQFTFQVPAGIAANSSALLTCTNTATGALTQPGTIFVGN